MGGAERGARLRRDGSLLNKAILEERRAVDLGEAALDPRAFSEAVREFKSQTGYQADVPKAQDF